MTLQEEEEEEEEGAMTQWGVQMTFNHMRDDSLVIRVINLFPSLQIDVSVLHARTHTHTVRMSDDL